MIEQLAVRAAVHLTLVVVSVAHEFSVPLFFSTHLADRHFGILIKICVVRKSLVK